uniref:Uncharacterized protein n=1 Tax=Alexandrium monilatum TaxID=311494 RepID=A0A6T1LAR2_9DINO
MCQQVPSRMAAVPAKHRRPGSSALSYAPAQGPPSHKRPSARAGSNSARGQPPHSHFDVDACSDEVDLLCERADRVIREGQAATLRPDAPGRTAALGSGMQPAAPRGRHSSLGRQRAGSRSARRGCSSTAGSRATSRCSSLARSPGSRCSSVASFRGGPDARASSSATPRTRGLVSISRVCRAASLNAGVQRQPASRGSAPMQASPSPPRRKRVVQSATARDAPAAFQQQCVRPVVAPQTARARSSRESSVGRERLGVYSRGGTPLPSGAAVTMPTTERERRTSRRGGRSQPRTAAAPRGPRVQTPHGQQFTQPSPPREGVMLHEPGQRLAGLGLGGPASPLACAAAEGSAERPACTVPRALSPPAGSPATPARALASEAALRAPPFWPAQTPTPRGGGGGAAALPPVVLRKALPPRVAGRAAPTPPQAPPTAPSPPSGSSPRGVGGGRPPAAAAHGEEVPSLEELRRELRRERDAYLQRRAVTG